MTETLRPWHDMFLLVGGASATLIGLVFVAVSMTVYLTGPAPRGRDLFATPVIFELRYALAIAATCLAPWGSARMYGVVIGTMGAVATTQSASLLWRLVRHHRGVQRLTRRRFILTGVAPITASLLVLGGGAATATGDMRGVAVTALGAVLLDAAAIVNSWQLFMYLLEQKVGRTDS